MRALTYDDYGGPETHRLRDDELVPEPGPGQVRVRVSAAGINPYDWHIYRADPVLVRFAFGLRGPGRRVVGSDLAGVVESVGDGVTEFAPGDRVAGMSGFGACGDLAVVDADRLATIPSGVDDVEAAALPIACITALNGLRQAGMAAGKRVLVIGASGGVGHIAVQVARALGASRVVAVCSGANAAMVRELGADRVIDYTREEVADCGETFDLVYDTVTTTTLRRLVRIIAPGGVYAPAGGVGGGRLLGPAWGIYRSVLAGWTVRPRVTPVSAREKDSGGDVAEVLAWVASGQVRVVVEALPLAHHREAFARLEGKHVAGKLVLTM